MSYLVLSEAGGWDKLGESMDSGLLSSKDIFLNFIFNHFAKSLTPDVAKSRNPTSRENLFTAYQ